MAGEFATVGAAVIGGGIAIVGLVLAKENKISEFRQQWIDGLRDDVSTMIGVAVAMRIQLNEPQNFAELLLRIYELEQRIALRFKKDAEEAAELLLSVRALVVAGVNRNQNSGFPVLLQNLRDATHVILESEWRRVKDGEFAYRQTLRWAKRLSIALTGTLLIWAVVHTVNVLVASLPEIFKG